MKQIFAKNATLLLLLAWTTITALQWLHFVYYFKQPVVISFIWSITDWSVWFVLFFTFLWLENKAKLNNSLKWLIPISFILFAGTAQILISSLLYLVIFDSPDTLLASIIKSLNKRWLQHLMIAVIFVLIHQLVKQKIERDKLKTPSKLEDLDKLTLFDGKRHHVIDQHDIRAITADKNYLSVFTNHDEIVVRSTLKEFVKQLDEQLFTQISRSTFVNKQTIAALFKYSRTSYRVALTDRNEFNVSKTYLPQIQSLISQGHINPS